MKTVYFIRHGSTAGNLEKRYVGRTDEPLCEKGILQAKALSNTGLPSDLPIFVSPMLRCLQTADIVFPNCMKTVIADLRETDFGIFEYKNYLELENNEQYRNWVDSGCMDPIPEGDDIAAFKERCVKAFLDCMETTDAAVFVVHGGVIMSILEKLARPKKDYYDYYVRNCELLSYSLEDQILTKTEASEC